MTQVFISYSRKDKLAAGKFSEALEQSDLDIWIDWEDIPPTADWLDQIHKGIEGSDAFLFLLSPDSVASKVCTQEVEHAVQNAKRLIPIIVGDIDPARVHPALAKVNWIYWREEDDFAGAVEKTLKAIRTDLAWVEFHRRLQVRALEWEKRGDPSLLLRGKDLREAEEQLATVEQKDPQPTDLQRKYVLAGRRGESRTRNLILAVGAVVLVAISLLSVFANDQRILAEYNAETAVANANSASTEKVNAQNNANAASTEKANAQKQEATAVANADLALARQLAAQSQLLGAESGLSMVQSALLAIESLHRYPTLEGDQALKRNMLLFPKLVSTLQTETELRNEVLDIAFSPDGKLLVSGGSDGTVHVWDVLTGTEIARFTHDEPVSEVVFSSDGRSVVTSSGDFIQIWSMAAGLNIATMQHDDKVNSVVIGLDGRTILSSSWDGSVRIWDLLTGLELNRFEHEDIVWDAVFSPDGSYVVSSGNDNARVWDIRTGEQVAEKKPAARVFQSIVSPNGKGVVSAGEETSYYWEIATGEEITRVKQPGNVLSIALSPESYWVASGSSDGTVLVWEAGTGNEISRNKHDWTAGFDAAMGSVQAIEFTPDGRFVLSGSIDGTARIWDAQTGGEITRLADDTYYGVNDVVDGFVNTVAFSPDGRFAAIGNSQGLVRIWEVNTSIGFMRIDRGYSIYSDVAISQDASRFAYEADDDAIHVLDLLTNTELASLPLNGDLIQEIGFSPDGRRIFSSGSNGKAWIWDIASGREVTTFAFQGLVSFSPDGGRIATIEGENTVVVQDTANKTILSKVTLAGRPISLAFNEDGNWIVIETDGGLAGIWDARTGRNLSQITGSFTRIALSPDAKWLATADNDNTVRLWDASSGNQVAKVNYQDYVDMIGFDPYSRYVASASGEDILNSGSSRGLLAILAVNTQTEVARIAFDSAVYSFAFSPDGRWIATYHSGGPARIWDVSTGVEVSRISGEVFGSINLLRFSPDGKWIITDGFGGYLNFRLWQHEDLIADLCSRLPRNLSRAEWRLYIGNEPYRVTCPNLPIESEAAPTPSP